VVQEEQDVVIRVTPDGAPVHTTPANHEFAIVIVVYEKMAAGPLTIDTRMLSMVCCPVFSPENQQQ
jgi:hypothetical protein